MTTLGSQQRPTTLGLLLVFLLANCGCIFDAPLSLFVTAQGSNGAGSSSSNNNNSGGGGSAPARTPSLAPVAPPTPAAECPLTCANGAECKLGEHHYRFHPKEPNGATFTFLQTTNKDGWYCDCPMGFTGLRCSRTYEVCPLALGDGDIGQEDQQMHFCYHGGKCIEGLTDGTHQTIDSTQAFCDCSNAEHDGVPYFGKYCEIQGAVRCSETSQQYCTAQGSCKLDFDEKYWPCDCLTGHRGPHCEFLRGSVPECTLPCDGTTPELDGVNATGAAFQGGQGYCRLGIREFDNARYKDLWAPHDENFQYCSCPDGWFGENCEVPAIECGDAHCFNGGGCLESLNQKGDKTFACDCRDAGHLGKSWAGQYCENAETSTCTGGALAEKLHMQHANGNLFCTNGGTCKDPDNPHLGCNCPEGRHGPSCEFQNSEDAQCSLQCQNGGQCRAGMKDNSLIEKLGKGISDYNATHHSELFEHCVCPHNFFGIECEHKLEICPGGDHVCLHGSQCIAENEGGTDGAEKKYSCDCDSAFDSLEKYAGKFCQYTSTDICTKNGQPGMGKANFAFCVNNGICKDKVNDGEDPPGCWCPDNFYGPHCEYLEGEDEDQERESYDDDGDYDYDGGYADTPPQSQAATESGKYSPNQRRIVTGLSIVVIVLVIVFTAFIARKLISAGSSNGSKAVDVQAAISEETVSSGDNMSGIIHSNTGDNSLEDIEVDDYVNNHSNVLSDKEMSKVQIV